MSPWTFPPFPSFFYLNKKQKPISNIAFSNLIHRKQDNLIQAMIRVSAKTSAGKPWDRAEVPLTEPEHRDVPDVNL